jgi:L-lactate dehydrogenase complex protein LldF
MQPDVHPLATRVEHAAANAKLQHTLRFFDQGFAAARAKNAAALREFEALRAEAWQIRDAAIVRLSDLLQQFEASTTAAGATEHWAEAPAEACAIVARIDAGHGVRTISKSKSMVSEEIGLNASLESAGFTVIETDLGEYVFQKPGGTPSHIVALAIHKSSGDVAKLFATLHGPEAAVNGRSDWPSLVAEASAIPRDIYGQAPLTITGANFLVSDSGTAIICINEVNADVARAASP